MSVDVHVCRHSVTPSVFAPSPTVRWTGLWLGWLPSNNASALFTPHWPMWLLLLCHRSAWREQPPPSESSQLKVWFVLQPGLAWLSVRLWPIWCLPESQVWRWADYGWCEGDHTFKAKYTMVLFSGESWLLSLLNKMNLYINPSSSYNYYNSR